jgi:outer membrane protein TolC
LVLGLAVILVFLSAASAQQQEQPLTLRQAVELAIEKNPLRKAAVAETKAASADVREARSFLLPHLNFSETATRGNDPVYVFGSRLRQQRFTSADFVPNSLNTPTPIGNFSTRLGGTWTLFDSFASWHGVNRARQMNEATVQELNRTDQEVVFRVISAYYQVVLARKQVDVAEQSVRTAQAITDRSQSRFDAGLVVQSDLLTAKVRLAARQQESIQARNDLELAHAQLNLAMGIPADSSLQPAEDLTEHALPLPLLAQAETQALTNRPELKRVSAEQVAQQENVAIAKSSFGPRVNAFAGWEMDNPTFVAGGGGNNWLGGIELQIDIFSGGAKRAELSRQRALEQKVIAMKQAASDAVRLEVRRAYYDADASRQQVEVARTAISEAQESLRINQDRYDTGLITITDLLGAEESARRSQTDYWEVLCRFHTSFANLELASGTLNPQSPVVTP